MSRYVTVKMTEVEAKAVRTAATHGLSLVDYMQPVEVSAGYRGLSKIANALLGDDPEDVDVEDILTVEED